MLLQELEQGTMDNKLLQEQLLAGEKSKHDLVKERNLNDVRLLDKDM